MSMKHGSKIKTLLMLMGVLAAARADLLATLVTNSPSIMTDSCESLRALKLPDTTIVFAERVAAQTMEFAVDHPQKLIDFGYRAVHETTIKAKLIIAGFYGQPPAFSYWSGSSTGGRQALMEVQRFPTDYNGIVAGDPVSNFDHLQASHLNKRIALDKNPVGFVPPE